MRKVDYHFLARPLTGIATECGDTGVILCDGSHCFVALIDALGHGPKAYEIASRARAYLHEHFRENLTAMMRGLHEYLKGTIGAVAALCRLDIETGEITYIGIGNIAVKILGTHPHTFVPRDGIIGYLLPSPREQSGQLVLGDVLVLYSDGIRQSVSFDTCTGLLNGDAAAIAGGIMEFFRKADDDASCISVRYIS